MREDPWLELPPPIAWMRDAGALFVLNHSAGKDSQAMTIRVREVVSPEQLLVVHADLGEVEWDGNLDHIRETVGDLPIEVCRNERKTLLEMVEHRGMWPSPRYRQCTSDLKRGPIDRTIRRYLRAHPRFGGRIVSCMGLRADESPDRAKRSIIARNARGSVAGREWWTWLPIHDLTTDEVFATIARAGQAPHWAYAAGMSRLSCVFCIMASRSDLRTAAHLRPDLYRRYVALERRIGHTLPMSGRPLEEVTGVPAASVSTCPRSSPQRSHRTAPNSNRSGPRIAGAMGGRGTGATPVLPAP